MPITNIAVSALLIAGFAVFFVPVAKWTKKLLDLEISAPIASIFILLAITGLLVFKTGLAGVIYLALAGFCLWAFAFGFLTDRRYIYTLALIFLAVCPFLLIAKLDQIAEFSAILCYLCLVLGVLKDLFYEKAIN